ncbi:MAG: hypothetical protein BKP49_09420 [Treponema sp. CETP13]|nr:MAG: hypothetical protein BKP49_09420 [Treponema sp. CETP13]
MRSVNIDSNDSKQILDIYTPFVTDTTVTFEYKVPTLQEFTQRIISISNKFPYLVYEKNNVILGYAYASKYNEREAYKFTVDLSIYVDQKIQGQGIGTALYDALCLNLQKQGYRTAYAIITSPNVPSENFHTKYGFKNLALFEKSGYKFNKWIDIRYMQLQLNEYSKSPELQIIN